MLTNDLRHIKTNGQAPRYYFASPNIKDNSSMMFSCLTYSYILYQIKPPKILETVTVDKRC